MAEFKFLTIQNQKTPLTFLFAFQIAREHYVGARICLQQSPIGIVRSGCLLAQQCVEMFVKAILHLDHKSADIHYLPKLLERGKAKTAYFDKLLTDQKLRYFIENLTLVNARMRFGEGGFTVEQQELTQILDEVAFNLNKTYLDMIKSKHAPLYVPDALKETFLRGNKYFTEAAISNDTLAAIPLP